MKNKILSTCIILISPYLEQHIYSLILFKTMSYKAPVNYLIELLQELFGNKRMNAAIRAAFGTSKGLSKEKTPDFEKKLNIIMCLSGLKKLFMSPILRQGIYEIEENSMRYFYSVFGQSCGKKRNFFNSLLKTNYFSRGYIYDMTICGYIKKQIKENNFDNFYQIISLFLIGVQSEISNIIVSLEEEIEKESFLWLKNNTFLTKFYEASLLCISYANKESDRKVRKVQKFLDDFYDDSTCDSIKSEIVEYSNFVFEECEYFIKEFESSSSYEKDIDYKKEIYFMFWLRLFFNKDEGFRYLVDKCRIKPSELERYGFNVL